MIGYLQSEVGNLMLNGGGNLAVLCNTWLPDAENQRSVLCNIWLYSEGRMSAVQQLLSLSGMNRHDAEGRLAESSSRTARSSADRTSAKTAGPH